MKTTNLIILIVFLLCNINIALSQNLKKKPMVDYHRLFGIGTFTYGWRINENDISNKFGELKDNTISSGIYCRFINFKRGNKYFSLDFSLARVIQFRNFKISCYNWGAFSGKYSLFKENSLSKDIELDIFSIDYGNISFGYDLFCFPRRAKSLSKGFYPLRFVISTYISTSIYEFKYMKMPFDYYDPKKSIPWNKTEYEINKEYIITSDKTYFIHSFFSSFEVGLKFQSSLYYLNIAYCWNYGKKYDFILNINENNSECQQVDYNSCDIKDIASGGKTLNFNYSGFFTIRLGLTFDWYFSK